MQIESQLLLDSILFLFVSSKEQRSHDNDDEYTGDQHHSSDRKIAMFGKTKHEITLDTFRCTGIGIPVFEVKFLVTFERYYCEWDKGKSYGLCK